MFPLPLENFYLVRAFPALLLQLIHGAEMTAGDNAAGDNALSAFREF